MQRGIGRLRAGGSGSVSLASLVAALYPASEVGAVYEGDFASGYQDSPGTTPVALVNDPVGLRLDKRLGPSFTAIPAVTNNFNTATWTKGTGWSAPSAASLACDGTQVGDSDVSTPGGSIPAVAGALIKWTLVVTATTGGLFFYPSSGAAIGPITTPGTYTGFGPAGNNIIRCQAGKTASISSVRIEYCNGYHAQQAAASSRPTETLVGANYADTFDGVDDSYASLTGGGGTTGFFWCGAVKVIGGAGGSRSVWSDTGVNIGYRVRIASTNKLAIGAGNGAAFTSATTTDNVDVGNTYVLCVWDDGVNLNAQVNLGTVASVARPVVSAGTAGFTVGGENGSATLFANIAIAVQLYKKNGSDVTAATRLACQRYCASKAGISI